MTVGRGFERNRLLSTVASASSIREQQPRLREWPILRFPFVGWEFRYRPRNSVSHEGQTAIRNSRYTSSRLSVKLAKRAKALGCEVTTELGGTEVTAVQRNGRSSAAFLRTTRFSMSGGPYDDFGDIVLLGVVTGKVPGSAVYALCQIARRFLPMSTDVFENSVAAELHVLRGCHLRGTVRQQN